MWDRYVERGVGDGGAGTAGDEWGDATVWEWRFDALFRPASVENWKTAFEIGPGAGKYTRRVLEESTAVVHCADISGAFLRLLAKQLTPFMQAGRVTMASLRGLRPDELLTLCEERGVRGTLDGLYSIDSMVHVDLQYLMAYLITGAICLRAGGALVLTLADPTTPRGLQKLLDDIGAFYPQQGKPTPKFEWVSNDMVRFILDALGFRVVRCDAPKGPRGNTRDLFVVAILEDAERGRSFEKYLRTGR
jgi:hypothetical protein